MKKVLVLFGGVSSEHDVSVTSASYVIKNLPADKYETVMMGITKEGEWFRYTGSPEALPNDGWLADKSKLTPAVLSPDRRHHGILIDGKVEKIDIIFPVLHGKNGEDGTMQGLMALSGIPYVGCDTLSSAMCMDKAITNTIADYFGIAQAKWCSVEKHGFEKDPNTALDGAVAKLGFPIFVKPANAGSSVGISKAKTKEELLQAIQTAFVHDPKVVLEESIIGAEVECAVMGNEEPVASVVGEIEPCNEFYDFDAKYFADSKLHIPARLPAQKLAEVQDAACRAYKALGCSGLARVDFFVREGDGAVLLNEPNTLPGFTAISMYPKLFGASGIGYADLLDRLLQLAEAR